MLGKGLPTCPSWPAVFPTSRSSPGAASVVQGIRKYVAPVEGGAGEDEAREVKTVLVACRRALAAPPPPGGGPRRSFKRTCLWCQRWYRSRAFSGQADDTETGGRGEVGRLLKDPPRGRGPGKKNTGSGPEERNFSPPTLAEMEQATAQASEARRKRKRESGLGGPGRGRRQTHVWADAMLRLSLGCPWCRAPLNGSAAAP